MAARVLAGHWRNLLKQIVATLRTDKEIEAAARFRIVAVIRH